MNEKKRMSSPRGSRSTMNLMAGLIILIGCYAKKSVADQVGTKPAVKDTNVVTAPPSVLNLDPFYKKYLDASGIPVIGSQKVPDEAFYAVQKMLNKMMSWRSDVLDKMIENKIRVGIMAKSEVTTDLPECRDWNKIFPGTDWNKRGRGYGATLDIPLNSCSEENILCYGKGIDWYPTEDIFIHEMAHGIHGLGIRFVDTTIDQELQQALDDAIAKGLYKNTYAATNIDEYFAEGVQDWFNVNAESIPANGIHNEINTREELETYDPVLYKIIERYFPTDNEKISCHQ